MLRVAPSWIETVKRIAATALAVGLLTVAATTAAHAEDSDQTRYYLLLKTLDTNPGTGVHDSHGLSFGVNLNRYLGFELSGDFWELRPSIPGYGEIGEMGVFALIPEVRLRYPLFDGRLTPYVIGGAGVAFSARRFTTHPGGHGMGLYLVRRICERYGWAIRLESGPDGVKATLGFDSAAARA